jgi:predicted esterase
MKLRHSLVLIPFLAAAAALAQSYTPGPQVLTFLSAVDDSDQPYALYLPRTFDPVKRYPLVVSLHGAGSNHRLNLKRVFGKGNLAGETDAEASRYFPAFRDVDFIVASPLARGTMGYQGIAERDVYDVLADVERRFPIDPDRVYLTGLSMGGGGTLWLGLTRPGVWAAIAPVCPHAPAGVEELAPNALNLPVHLFQGDQDPVVPPAGTRQWQKRLLDLGAAVDYNEYPGVRHNSWELAYKDGSIFDWFARFRRNRFPDRVRFVSRAYRYNAAYWVELDALTPGTLASVDARFTAPNRIAVETGSVDGFTLRLAGHAKFTAGQAVEVSVDGAAVRVRPAATLSFHREAGVWKAGRAPVAGKRPGAEGPLGEVVSERHIYVYGTADSPAPLELKRRRMMAERAAEWSEPRSRLQLALPVKADRDVEDKELDTASLVLFGDRQTNRVIARWAARLPVELNPGAADYGLLYVYPAGKHYLLISSGLPWWTGAGARPGGYRFAPGTARLLSTFGDFALFKGSLAEVVAEGRFDGEWKLPSAAAKAMLATGTVTVK